MDLSLLYIGTGLIVFSFVQGMGYAVATWFFNRKIEKHLDVIEAKLKLKQ